MYNSKTRFSLRKRKTGIIQPVYSQKENAMKFLQKKVDLWRHNTNKQQPESVPPTPPPKKSHTAPNLTIITDPELLMNRALPRLPSLQSITIEKKTSGISRATTWVGKSIQKWLSSAGGEEKVQTPTLQQEPEMIVHHAPNFLNKKMTLHCRILQVTNLTSSKNYEYTMHINVTNNPTQTHAGTMKRVAKGLSAAHPRAALSFNVEGQFQLECDLRVKPSYSNTLVGRLRSLGSDLDESEIRGKLCLDSGQDPLSSFANKGIGRYAIKTSTVVTMELTIAFWLDDDESEEQKLVTPIDQDILRYCQAGDYLTFYVKGETYPMWNRYWVTFEANHMVLRLNERGGEPFDKIPLERITRVDTNPSDDIKEQVYLGKKHTIVLTFENSNMYLFCDHFKSMRFWKSLFEQHMTNYTDTHKTDKKIHSKYLWPSVAQ